MNYISVTHSGNKISRLEVQSQHTDLGREQVVS